MGRIAFEREVYSRLQGRKYLEPIFSGGNYDMTRRLQEYDKDIFIAWNHRRKRYEVHSLGNQGSTYACDVPENRLDARLETAVRKGDIRVRGDYIFREMDEHNAILEIARQAARRNQLEGIADEVYPYFRRAGWEGI